MPVPVVKVAPETVGVDSQAQEIREPLELPSLTLSVTKRWIKLPEGPALVRLAQAKPASRAAANQASATL